MQKRHLALLVTAVALTTNWLSTEGRAAVNTFGGNAQHTAIYQPAAQNLNLIRWSTPIDLNPGAFAHYGAPLITAANTVLVPVKTAANGFQVNAFNGADGAAKYTLTTDYILPSSNWIPTYNPTVATGSFGTRLYYAGAGGTVFYIDNPDSASHGAPVRLVFYTSLANYQSNAAAFNSTVFINTPITPDTNGNIFFGFRVQNTAPAPLSTTQSGFARIDPNGVATYVLAGTAAGDANIARDSHNSAPALSNDETTVYVAVKAATTESNGYLLGLNATTLATKFKVFLKDPRNGGNATILDDSTASPTVAPDGDVYFGIFAGNTGSRGFLLRFSGDLTTVKTPGAFGWDYTPVIVPASMVPSYTGSSSYLIFSKYNNYAPSDGDGVNKIALLDPNATQIDPHPSANGLVEMREVLTVIGPTPDSEFLSPTFPNAVREWCINTAAVNPVTNSIFFPSEDGRLYRWNLVTNSLSQAVVLTPGIGEPYVPSVIGPDGTVYTLNGGTLFALGGLNGVAVSVVSSVPDLRTVVVGQSLTFTAAIANAGGSGGTPTGNVTFQDLTYQGTTPVTTTLSTIPLDGSGHASLTTSALGAGSHFITATYNGDGTFSAGSMTLVQKIHASASTTTLASSPNPSNPGQTVTFTATVVSAPLGSGTPTGMVTFQEGSNVLAQIPLHLGSASFNTSALGAGSHGIAAQYSSDSIFASSSGNTTQVVQSGLSATTTTVSSSSNPSVFGQSVTFTAIVTASPPGSGAPTSTVTFKDGSTTLATRTLDGAGRATFATSALTVGAHSITAVYGGDANFSGSSSATLNQTVNKAASTTTLTSSLNPSTVGQTVTFTATVVAKAPGSGIPAGTITFKDKNKTLGSASLDATGRAAFTTSSLNQGTHQMTAEYAGNANFLASVSNTQSQSVKK